MRVALHRSTRWSPCDRSRLNTHGTLDPIQADLTAWHGVLIVSHDRRVVRTFCDRALLLDGGRVAFEGSGEAVAERYMTLLTTPSPRCEISR